VIAHPPEAFRKRGHRSGSGRRNKMAPCALGSSPVMIEEIDGRVHGDGATVTS
jgi:hypothetical protein